MNKKALLFAATLLAVAPAVRAVDYVAAGRAYLAQSNLVAANSSFASAVAANPSDPTANVFYAGTRMMSVYNQAGVSAFLTKIGVGTTGRNLYNWTATFPDPKNIPSGTAMNEITAVFRANLVTTALAAEANLQKVTDTSFTLQLTSSDLNGASVTLDYGDIQMLRAMLQGVAMFADTLDSWNLPVTFGDIQNMMKSKSNTLQQLLTKYPALLNYANTTDLAAGKTAFQNAVASYQAASDFIRNHRDPAARRLFNLSPKEVQQEANFRQLLADQLDSLTTPTPLTTDPTYTISMAAFFDGKHPLRSILPTISGNHFIMGSWPDVTLGGLFPQGLTVAGLDNAFRHLLQPDLSPKGLSFNEVYAFSNSMGAATLAMPQTLIQGQGTDNNFYGFDFGGSSFQGMRVFKVTSGGVVSTAVSFDNADQTAGFYPSCLIQAKDGSGTFYGTMQYGGQNGQGTVFKATSAGVITPLVSFDGVNGGSPVWLVQGTDGFLYGVTSSGGDFNMGTVFKVSTSGAFTQLASFNGANGAYPNFVLAGSGGSLYGTTGSDGSSPDDNGHIFQWTSTGGLTSLATFNSPDGDEPNSLVQSGGDFYGTTFFNGRGAFPDGTAFKYNQASGLTMLHEFMSTDGSRPSSMIMSGGALYGITFQGGTANINGQPYGGGVVFKITPGAAAPAFTQLHGFGGGEGMFPTALLLGRDGSLYGATSQAGPAGQGTVFKMSTSGSSFATVAPPSGVTVTGFEPDSLVLGKDNNFYGATLSGGANHQGLAFRLTSAGQISFLGSFDQTTGYHANGLIRGFGSDTSLYGTAQSGGDNYQGTVFSLASNGEISDVLSFEYGSPDGSLPLGPLAQGPDGNFYGTTSQGGGDSGNGGGTVFRLTPAGALTTLHNFSGGPDGSQPQGGLLRAADGFLYGTTYGGGDNYAGTVFKTDTNGDFSIVAPFDWNNGANPVGSLIQDSNGNFYGVTTTGGPQGNGTVFRMTSGGDISVLYAFGGGIKDGTPNSTLLQLSDGSLLGTTATGGPDHQGSVFEIKPNGSFAPVVWFNGDNGQTPSSPLVLGPDGNIYGTTQDGGSKGGGNVFRLVLTNAPFVNGVDYARTAAVGSSANFFATVGGTPTLTFQWQRNGVNLVNGARISGANSSHLAISSLTTADAGSYTLVVRNSAGAATSVPAALTIIVPPSITTQPAGKSVPTGTTVTFSVKAAGATPLFFQWLKGGAPLADAGDISGSTSSNLTITTAMQNDAGNYSVTVSNAFGTVVSSNALLTLTRDTQPPTVSITSPAANARSRTPVLAGTASDNIDVAGVNYWITNLAHGLGTPNTAAGVAALASGKAGAHTWSIAALPSAGSNILAVQSIDFQGNVSPVKSQPFFVISNTAFLLTTNLASTGSGTITGAASVAGDKPPTNGALLNIGEGYTLTAKPDPRSVLSNWVSTAAAPGTNLNYNFIMQPGLAIQAQFATNLFLRMAGTYNGLFFVSSNGSPAVAEETAGMLYNLVLRTNGLYTAQLLVNGAPAIAVSGSFNQSGRSTVKVPLAAAKGGPLWLDLYLQWNSSPAVITGNVTPANTNNNWAAYLMAGRGSNALKSASYTTVLPPGLGAPTNSPGGWSSILITNKAGSVNLTFNLADNSPVQSQTVPVTEDGYVPVYLSLYNNTGLLLGWIHLTDSLNANGLTWIKKPAATGLYPRGFTNVITQSLGSVWTNPPAKVPALKLPTGHLSLSGGGLATNLTFNVGVSNNNAIVKLPGSPANALTAATIDPKTGKVTLTFGTGSGAATATAVGAALQNINCAFGSFLVPGRTNSGAMTLTQ